MDEANGAAAPAVEDKVEAVAKQKTVQQGERYSVWAATTAIARSSRYGFCMLRLARRNLSMLIIRTRPQSHPHQQSRLHHRAPLHQPGSQNVDFVAKEAGQEGFEGGHTGFARFVESAAFVSAELVLLAIENELTKTAKTAEPLLAHLGESDSAELAEKAKIDNIPEVIVYLRLLLILLDLDAGKVKEAGEYAMETVEYAAKANKRTLDQITAKVYFYLARSYEIQGRLVELQP